VSVVDAARRRWRGDFTVNAFGLDEEIHDAAVRLGQLRWRIVFDGAEHVPESGPALLVVQRRIGFSEQAVVAVGVASATTRRVHSAGIPGVQMIEAPLRRVGAMLAHPAEMTAMLRDGHLVSVGMGWSPIHDDVGSLSSAVMTIPLVLGVPVLPVAVRGREWGRTWRVRVGAPIRVHGLGDDFIAATASERVRSEVRRLHEGLRGL
jgi:hypothetical protein